MKFKVMIDGEANTLAYDRHSGARGHQYLTNGNASSHAFSTRLHVGLVFNTNGHRYAILEAL